MSENTLELRVGSYNLRENTAMGEMGSLISRNELDVLCVQECDSNKIPDTVGGLRLAGATSENRLGLALYYKPERLRADHTNMYALRKSIHDRVLVPANERLLATRFTDAANDTDVVIGSFHAAPLSASNRLRRKQISAAHECVKSLSSGIPTLLVGDYNYPWFQRRLDNYLQGYGVTVDRPEAATYHRGRYFTGSFDFVTSVGVQIDSVVTLPKQTSDHSPIVVSARPQTRARVVAA